VPIIVDRGIPASTNVLPHLFGVVLALHPATTLLLLLLLVTDRCLSFLKSASTATNMTVLELFAFGRYPWGGSSSPNRVFDLFSAIQRYGKLFHSHHPGRNFFSESSSQSSCDRLLFWIDVSQLQPMCCYVSGRFSCLPVQQQRRGQYFSWRRLDVHQASSPFHHTNLGRTVFHFLVCLVLHA
jgi:hypothetical protein